MIDELGATKFAEIYSPHFPPQVFVGKDGIIECMVNELYYLKSQGEDERDFIILVGNTQGLSPEGQYELCGIILDFVESYGVKQLFTLGGLATGRPVEETNVLVQLQILKILNFLKKRILKYVLLMVEL